MGNNIFHYFILIALVASFAGLYFFLLRKSAGQVGASQTKLSSFYSFFAVRISLAFIFFFFLIKYYNDIIEVFIIILTFAAVKWLFVKIEKKKIKHKGKK